VSSQWVAVAVGGDDVHQRQIVLGVAVGALVLAEAEEKDPPLVVVHQLLGDLLDLATLEVETRVGAAAAVELLDLMAVVIEQGGEAVGPAAVGPAFILPLEHAAARAHLHHEAPVLAADAAHVVILVVGMMRPLLEERPEIHRHGLLPLYDLLPYTHASAIVGGSQPPRTACDREERAHHPGSAPCRPRPQQ